MKNMIIFALVLFTFFLMGCVNPYIDDETTPPVIPTYESVTFSTYAMAEPGMWAMLSFNKGNTNELVQTEILANVCKYVLNNSNAYTCSGDIINDDYIVIRSADSTQPISTMNHNWFACDKYSQSPCILSQEYSTKNIRCTCTKK